MLESFVNQYDTRVSKNNLTGFIFDSNIVAIFNNVFVKDNKNVMSVEMERLFDDYVLYCDNKDNEELINLTEERLNAVKALDEYLGGRK